MSKDNVKTWPGRMWFSLLGYGNKIPKFHEVEADDLLFCYLPRYGKNIEYIRADIAKEREKELIRAAFKERSPPRVNWSARGYKKEIYGIAGLEELKERKL